MRDRRIEKKERAVDEAWNGRRDGGKDRCKRKRSGEVSVCGKREGESERSREERE